MAPENSQRWNNITSVSARIVRLSIQEFRATLPFAGLVVRRERHGLGMGKLRPGTAWGSLTVLARTFRSGRTDVGSLSTDVTSSSYVVDFISGAVHESRRGGVSQGLTGTQYVGHAAVQTSIAAVTAIIIGEADKAMKKDVFREPPLIYSPLLKSLNSLTGDKKHRQHYPNGDSRVPTTTATQPSGHPSMAST